MSSRRVLKAAQAIREVVSMAIITDLKDPRISDVTVTLVAVSADMRNAKVSVSVMGDETKQKLCLHGLQNSAGFLQQKIGRRIDTRYTPRIEFVLDKGIQHAMTVTRILEEVLPKSDEVEVPESDLPESNPGALPESDLEDSSVDTTDSGSPLRVEPGSGPVNPKQAEESS